MRQYIGENTHTAQSSQNFPVWQNQQFSPLPSPLAGGAAKMHFLVIFSQNVKNGKIAFFEKIAKITIRVILPKSQKFTKNRLGYYQTKIRIFCQNSHFLENRKNAKNSKIEKQAIFTTIRRIFRRVKNRKNLTIFTKITKISKISTFPQKVPKSMKSFQKYTTDSK